MAENNIEKFFNNSRESFNHFSKSYITYLCDLLNNVDLKQVERLKDIFLDARESDSAIYFIGNGGSISTASHFAQDLGLGKKTDSYYKNSFRTLSLAEPSAFTALANDEGYENVFLGQLKYLYREGDVLVSISASGNSPNLIKAVEYVNQKKGMTFGILGFDGGKLKELCKDYILINTLKGEYGPVESVHLCLAHIIVNYLSQHISENG